MARYLELLGQPLDAMSFAAAHQQLDYGANRTAVAFGVLNYVKQALMAY